MISLCSMQSYCKLCMKSRAVPKDSDTVVISALHRKRRQLAVPDGQLHEDIEAMQRAHGGGELAIPIQMGSGMADFMVRTPHLFTSVACLALCVALELLSHARSYVASRKVKAMAMDMVWSMWSRSQTCLIRWGSAFLGTKHTCR